MTQQLVLSLFPGVGMLDMAFEAEGFCVVRGPDLIFGGDVRTFRPPAGKFDGVIGGPPCQSFSMLNTLQEAQGRQGRHGNMIPEFERCVEQAGPVWFLMENVKGAPLPAVEAYTVQSHLVRDHWCGGETMRMRRFSYGSLGAGRFTIETEALHIPNPSAAVTASDGGASLRMARYRLDEMLKLSGLPADFFKDSPLTIEGKRQMIGNGVPMAMGRAVARAVRSANADERGQFK